MKSAISTLGGRPVRAFLAAIAFLLFTSTASGQACTFVGGASSLTFASLDPSTAVTVTAFADLSVFCFPLASTPAWQFTGVNGNAPLQMKHTTQNSFIPYSVSVNRVSTGLFQTWRLTATVLGPNYQNAFVGSYSDVLTATITP